MKKKNVTIDDLAIMVAKGFDGVDLRFNKIDQRFDAVDRRLEKIEKFLLEDHRRRIEKLEEQMKYLRDLLAVK